MTVSEENAQTIITTGLGTVGGLLSVLLGPQQMPWYQRVGCVLAGAACAFVGAPLIPALFPTAGDRVTSLAGFVLGLSGLFLVRGVTMWFSRFEVKIPDELDRRTGMDTKPTPKPLVPEPPSESER